LKIFGSECFVYQIPKQKRHDQKFGKASKRGIFVRYEDVTGNYRVCILEEKQIKISRDVEFQEIAVPEALIDLSQEEEETEVTLEKEQKKRIQKEDQEKQSKQSTSAYQLRNRETIQTPQRFTYLCQRTPVESNSYKESSQVSERDN